MRVIVVASHKGGSGKTTLAAHLAVAAERAGAGPVVLLDIDPRGALIDWWEARPDHAPAFAQCTAASLAEDLDTLRRKGYRLAIVDTPPAASETISGVIALAELVIVPTRGSLPELRALTATLHICADTGRQAAVAIMAAQPDAVIDRDAAIALSQHGALAPATVHLSDDISAAMSEGSTALERNPGCLAATEVRALWRYLAGRLESNFRRTVFTRPAMAAASGFGRRVAAYTS
jgi:chromosome partitioning protein